MTNSDAFPDVLPPIESYFEALRHMAKEYKLALRTVGGNILIHVLDCASLTIVTKGPRAGVHSEFTDDPIDFTFAVEEWLLVELLDPECNVDIDAAIADGYMMMEGDYEVYENFMRLADRRSMVDIRAAA